MVGSQCAVQDESRCVVTADRDAPRLPKKRELFLREFRIQIRDTEDYLYRSVSTSRLRRPSRLERHGLPIAWSPSRIERDAPEAPMSSA